MYIQKYLDNYLCDSDDSLTFLEYLEGKEVNEIAVSKLMSEIGLDKLESLKETEGALQVVVEDFEVELNYAITIVADLAALLLECKKSGSVNISEIMDDDMEAVMNITATVEDYEWFGNALKEFAEDPMSYDVSEMMGEEEMLEMAKVYEELGNELSE